MRKWTLGLEFLRLSTCAGYSVGPGALEKICKHMGRDLDFLCAYDDTCSIIFPCVGNPYNRPWTHVKRSTLPHVSFLREHVSCGWLSKFPVLNTLRGTHQSYEEMWVFQVLFLYYTIGTIGAHNGKFHTLHAFRGIDAALLW